MGWWDSITSGLLWYKIITGTITSVITLLIAIYLQFFFRRGWTSEKRRITSISCVHQNVRTCQRPCKNCATTCTAKKQHVCKVGVMDHHGLMSKTYAELPPEVKDEVEVYYNPKRPESTMSLDAADVGMIVFILAVVALFSGGYAFFLYKNRDNEAVKDVNAVLALSND